MQRPRINLTSTPSDAQMPEIGTTATWTPTKTCQNMWFTSLSACVKLQAYRETCGLRITIIRTLGSLSNTGVGIVLPVIKVVKKWGAAESSLSQVTVCAHPRSQAPIKIMWHPGHNGALDDPRAPGRQWRCTLRLGFPPPP